MYVYIIYVYPFSNPHTWRTSIAIQGEEDRRPAFMLVTSLLSAPAY